MHVVAFAPEYVRSVQDTQEPALSYVPAGHASQIVWLAFETKPGSHAVQLVEFSYEICSTQSKPIINDASDRNRRSMAGSDRRTVLPVQLVQEEAPKPEYVPAGHVVHAEPENPVAPEYVPAGHDEHVLPT